MSAERHLRAVEDPAEGRPLAGAEAFEVRRAKRVGLWVGLILPLALVGAGTALLISWVPRMPVPAATHWGFSGGPDGFGSPWTYVWLLAGLGGGLVIALRLMVGVGGLKPGAPSWSATHRFMAAFAAGYGVFSCVTNIGSAAVQLDLADAAEAPGVGSLAAVGFALWTFVGAVAWFVQPKVVVRPAPGEPSEPLPLSETDRAVWVAEIRPSRTFAWVLGSTLVLTAATGLWLVLLDDGPGGWILGGVVALMLALAATCSWFRVRIDERGLEARSALGWPRFSVAAEDVARVEVRDIHPLGEWGGWGLRWVPGTGFGIVMRTGEGMLITRRDGRLFAMTVDDAETGASLLGAVVER